MSRALLDTSGYSAFMRGDPAIKEMLQTVDAIYLNPIVLGGTSGRVPAWAFATEKRNSIESVPGFVSSLDSTTR